MDGVFSALSQHREEHVAALKENVDSEWTKLEKNIDQALSPGDVKQRDSYAKTALDTVNALKAVLESANNVFRQQFMLALLGNGTQ